MPCLQFQVTNVSNAQIVSKYPWHCPKNYQILLVMPGEFTSPLDTAWWVSSFFLLSPEYSQPICIAQRIFKSYWQCSENFQVLLMMPRQFPSLIVTDGGVFLTHCHSPHYFQIPLAIPGEYPAPIGITQRASKTDCQGQESFLVCVKLAISQNVNT